MSKIGNEGGPAGKGRVKTAGALVLASAMVFGPFTATADDRSRAPAPRSNNNTAEKPYLPELGDGCMAGAIREWAERIEKADGYDLLVLLWRSCFHRRMDYRRGVTGQRRLWLPERNAGIAAA